MSGGVISVTVWVAGDTIFPSMAAVWARAELPPTPWRRSDAETKYRVMKREARERDWNRYRRGVVIAP